MLLQIGLIVISAAWIFQIIKGKKNEISKNAFLIYVIGAGLLAINGFIDGAVSDADILETMTLVTSGIVLARIWKTKK